MCGIGGSIGSISGRTVKKVELESLMAALKHRGPDGTGFWFDRTNQLSLGHNRLSINDLSDAGSQPMVNPENNEVLVFNGEIYNFLELRAELITLGYRFRSKTDTEVLLYALGQWGLGALNRIEGMYAFALWRPRHQELLLVRDPMGIKPLYVWRSGGDGLVFASEVKAFFVMPEFSGLLDPQALRQFLEFGYTFDEQRTCLLGVEKIPPGHFLSVSPSEPNGRLNRYYVPANRFDETVQPPSEDQLYETLSDVVRQHLIADVPIGLLLSGGLDSSLLAAMAARHTQVKTISMGFSDSKLDERPYAQFVADYLKTDHQSIILTPKEIQSGLPEAIRCFDDLFADWGTISTRLLYQRCRELGIKAVIVGEGSDEIFGGYDVFRRSYSRLPTDLWLFHLYRHYAGRRHGRLFRRFRDVMRSNLRESRGDRFDAIRLFESRQQLPNNYVMKVDKASMAASVEARVPFLDRRVAALAYRSPGNLLLSPNNEKIMLRNMAAKYALLPEQATKRRKVGGSIAADWMDDKFEWRGFTQDIILDSGSWTRELGLLPAMEAYFIQGRSGYRAPHPLSIFRNLAWRLLILELWSKAFRITPHAI